MRIRYKDIFGKEAHREELCGDILSYIRKKLPDDKEEMIKQHLTECAACRLTLVELEDALSFIKSKTRQNFSRGFRRNPARYVVPLFSSSDESVSIEELSVIIKDCYGYSPDIQVLEQMLTQESSPGRGKTSKGKILQQISSEPTLYRLVEGLYERYKRLK